MNEAQADVNLKLKQQLRWCLQMFETLSQENRASLSRANGGVNGRINGGTVTSPNMTEPSFDRNSANNCAFVDWSFSRDDVDNDVTAKNMDNDRYTRQWRKTKIQPSDHRKSSFSLFSKLDRKNRAQEHLDFTRNQDEGHTDRGPKRFFSQQNLRTISMDEATYEECPQRHITPKFLWRLSSKYRSQQDLPRAGISCVDRQSLKSNDKQMFRVLSSDNASTKRRDLQQNNIIPEYEETDEECCDSDSRTLATGYRRNVSHSVPMIDVGVQVRTRCSSWSGSSSDAASGDFSSPPAHFYTLNHIHRQRSNLQISEFSSNKCLGDYRPRLNTHYEEPAADGAMQNQSMATAECKAQKRWSMHSLGACQETALMSGKSVEQRQHIRSSSDERNLLDVQQFSGSLEIDPQLIAHHEVSLRNGRLSEVPTQSRSLLMANASSGFCSNESDLRQKRPSAFVRNDEKNFSCDSGVSEDQTSLPLSQTRCVEKNSQKHCERLEQSQVDTMRRLSQELYSDHLLAQRKAISYANTFTSSGDPTRRLVNANQCKPSDGGFSSSSFKQYNSSISFANADDHMNIRPSAERPCPNRSLSMSHLPTGLRSTSESVPRWYDCQQNGMKDAVTILTARAEANEIDDDMSLQNEHFNLSCQEHETPRCNQKAGKIEAYHQRGGSLDSSVARNSSYDSLSEPYCTEHQMSDGFMYEQDVGNLHRCIYDASERPLRCKFFQRQASNDELHTGRSTAMTKQMQQQAMISLFQKLTLLRQQKHPSNSSINSAEERLQASHKVTDQGMNVARKNCNTGSQTNWDAVPNTHAGRSSSTDLAAQAEAESAILVDRSVLHPFKERQFNFYSSNKQQISGDGSEILRISENGSCTPEFSLNINRKQTDFEVKQQLNSRMGSIHNSRSSTLDQESHGQGQTNSKVKCQGQMNPKTEYQHDASKPHGVHTIPQEQYDSRKHFPPPELPPKTYRLQNSLNMTDQAESPQREGRHIDTGVFLYADHLRQEARRLSQSTGSLLSSSSFKIKGSPEEKIEATNEPRAENEVEYDEMPHDFRLMNAVNEDEISAQLQMSPEKATKLRHSESPNFIIEQESVTIQSTSSRSSPKALTTSENQEKDRNMNFIEEKQEKSQYAEEGVQRGLKDGQKSSFFQNNLDPHIFRPEFSPKRSPESNLQVYFSSNGEILNNSKITTCDVDSALIKTRLATASLSDIRSESLKTFTVKGNEGCGIRALVTEDLPHSLKDVSDSETSSTDDENFHSLSSVLCRHLRDYDEELCKALRPAQIKSSAEFVRRVFEGRKSPPVICAPFQSPIDLQKSKASRTAETSQASFKTLKDELLKLAEKRLQRQTERKQQLSKREAQILILKRKVTETVRQKIDSKRFEKFLSYLEQLEKVLQLLLNLSTRLLNVDRALCQLSTDDANETEKKRLTEKRFQILLRIQEASELKISIDERSQQVSSYLNEHLSQTEFEDFRLMVRDRCHLLLQRQAIDDQNDLTHLQKRLLTDRCHATLGELNSLQLETTIIQP